jgi:hypothetical protein
MSFLLILLFDSESLLLLLALLGPKLFMFGWGDGVCRKALIKTNGAALGKGVG